MQGCVECGSMSVGAGNNHSESEDLRVFSVG